MSNTAMIIDAFARLGLHLAAQLKISRTNFKGGVAANVSDLDSPVFPSVAHNRHRVAELFGSLRVSTHFDLIFLPGVNRISDSSTSINFEFIKLTHLFGSSLTHFF